ncbi:MAG: hypothetical protein IPI83_03270 [Sphingomonadales bacterium]|nr:hypothetical protein [Sphingomonadales bacterium]
MGRRRDPEGADGQYRIADPHMREQILGLRFDPKSPRRWRGFADDNADMLRNRFGEEPEPVDLYLAHFLGAQGASQFLSAWRADPNAPAAPMNPAAAAANRTIFYNPDGSAGALMPFAATLPRGWNEQPSGFPVSGTVERRWQPAPAATHNPHKSSCRCAP